MIDHIDPLDAVKWAAGVTALLGSIAFGIQRVLTLWGKGNTHASGVAAANDIIAALREEIGRIRKAYNDQQTENDELLQRVSTQNRMIIKLKDMVHMLQLNARSLRAIIEAKGITIKGDIHIDINLDEDEVPTFSSSDIGNIEINDLANSPPDKKQH